MGSLRDKKKLLFSRHKKGESEGDEAAANPSLSRDDLRKHLLASLHALASGHTDGGSEDEVRDTPKRSLASSTGDIPTTLADSSSSILSESSPPRPERKKFFELPRTSSGRKISPLSRYLEDSEPKSKKQHGSDQTKQAKLKAKLAKLRSEKEALELKAKLLEEENTQLKIFLKILVDGDKPTTAVAPPATSTKEKGSASGKSSSREDGEKEKEKDGAKTERSKEKGKSKKGKDKDNAKQLNEDNSKEGKDRDKENESENEKEKESDKGTPAATTATPTRTKKRKKDRDSAHISELEKGQKETSRKLTGGSKKEVPSEGTTSKSKEDKEKDGDTPQKEKEEEKEMKDKPKKSKKQRDKSSKKRVAVEVKSDMSSAAAKEDS